MSRYFINAYSYIEVLIQMYVRDIVFFQVPMWILPDDADTSREFLLPEYWELFEVVSSNSISSQATKLTNLQELICSTIHPG